VQGHQLIRNARVVLDDQVLDDGWVLIQDGVIAQVGSGVPPTQLPAAYVVDIDRCHLMPGFIDVHVHGGGGFGFDTGPDDALRAAAFHARHGTTSLLAGLSTAPWADICTNVAALADLPSRDLDESQAARILGTYLEGPFISVTRKGAHDPALIRVPEKSDVAEIVSRGRGSVKVATVAPEVPNGMAAIGWFTSAGVAVSIGHTDATGDMFDAAATAGGTCLTHTFNGMRPPTHRDPAVFQAITSRRVNCEVICDGLHVHPVYIRMLRELVGADRPVLVTDAVSWAGQPDGSYRSEGRAVEVRAGRVWLSGTDTLAGSCLTMGDAVRNYAEFTGAGPVELAKVSATNAAARLGLDHRLGRIRPGFPADLVALGPDHSVRAVMRGGKWLREYPGDGE
jgi:N-acetylglucosamine-6-phosphate deacetylase